jgi:3-oxoacyl-[acyl-carrier-protein] synthase-3
MASTPTHDTARIDLRSKLRRSIDENGDGRQLPTNAVSAPQLLTSRPGRLGALTGVQVLACGAYAPAEVVRNEDLADLGYDADWILQRTGIRQRRRAAPDEATSDMAYHAARDCLARAGVRPRDVDLILVATGTPDNSMPSTACHLQRRLGAAAPAMDINAACAGFVYALVTGMQFVKSGSSRRALVVGADLMTRVVDPADKKTFPLFGDGAGAVLLGAADGDQGLPSYTLGADGDGADLLVVPAGGSREPISATALAANRQFLQMDGRAVFKWAVRLLAGTTQDVLQHAGQTPDDLDLVVFHQANIRIIDAVADELQVDREKLVINLDRYGNTSGASIPLALNEALDEGRVRRGDSILLCGFGAGLAWGTALLKW